MIEKSWESKETALGLPYYQLQMYKYKLAEFAHRDVLFQPDFYIAEDSYGCWISRNRFFYNFAHDG